ncbi:nuclear transport factor 2 family protein [Nitrospirillum sp. BR 11163]|uniref:nuclear transport factor 2 family protein n=1 Tax=Nitrospirillum sp. BR 11163 TaxID=3104323 RepID=UPI002AFF94E1|nr:nuclear transport factor 2 family protein [Nitrospirillum sp. BR 11163]MEA1676041.1 nuclear transport factor 2 family protein [Nitrospirillum sp. BR 11163]
MTPAPPSSTLAPEQVVDGQLRAYNAKDIDAFMAYWAEDARIYQHPDTLLASGAGEIRARHVIRFQEPNLHGRLLHRLAVGATVVDHEVVTRTFPDGPGTVEVIGIYEVTAGRISRAWFTTGSPVLG